MSALALCALLGSLVWAQYAPAPPPPPQGCSPGFYLWVENEVSRCPVCIAGCACPGGWAACVGCSGGTYSGPGATACTACPAGTTTDPLYNIGCNPGVNTAPCANWYGPLGYAACRPIPPPENFTAGLMEPRVPSGALHAPPQRDMDNHTWFQASY